MKVGSLLLCAVLLPAMLPTLAHAEIYKWKDKDGSTRYSDVPPPSDIKNESIGKRIPKAAPAAVAAPAENGAAPAVAGKAGDAAAKGAPPLSKEEAAAKRAQEAEAQKKADAVKQAEFKYRQESCAAARKNKAMFGNGGRVMTTDDKGERHYLGDEDINKGKADAQRDVDKFCD